VLSVAAQDLRPGRPYGPPNPTFDRALSLEKLRTVLHMARLHGDKALVLAPIGCGAFRNPPRDIAELYLELLGPGGEFEKAFELVVMSTVYSEANLRAFEQAFGPSVPLEEF